MNMTKLQLFPLSIALILLPGCSREDKEPLTNAEKAEVYRGVERYQRDNPSMRLTPEQSKAVAQDIIEGNDTR